MKEKYNEAIKILEQSLENMKKSIKGAQGAWKTEDVSPIQKSIEADKLALAVLKGVLKAKRNIEDYAKGDDSDKAEGMLCALKIIQDNIEYMLEEGLNDAAG